MEENIIIPKKRKRRWLRAIGWVVVVFFLIMTSATLGLKIALHYRQDTVREYLTTELNSLTMGEWSMGNIDVSLFTNFPYISLEVADISLFEATNSGNRKRILLSDKSYLSFNLYNIIKSQHVINRMDFNGVMLNIVEFQDGLTSLGIALQPREVKTHKNPLIFEIKDIYISDVKLRFSNYDNFKFNLSSKKSHLKLRYHKDEVIINADFNSIVDSLPAYDIFSDKNAIPIALSGKLKLNTTDGVLSFTDNQMVIGGLSSVISGYTTIDAEGKTDITIKSSAKNLKVIGVKPKRNELYIHETGSGSIASNLRLWGPRKNLSASGYIDASNIGIHINSTGRNINNIDVSANFTIPSIKKPAKNSRLNVKRISVTSDSSSFSGSFSTHGTKKINLKGTGTISLADIDAIFGIRQGAMGGKLNFDSSWSYEASDGVIIRDSGYIDIVAKEVFFHPNEKEKFINNLTGKLRFNNGKLTSNDISAKIGENHFNVELSTGDVTNYIINHNHNVPIKIVLKSEHIYADLINNKLGITAKQNDIANDIKDFKLGISTIISEHTILQLADNKRNTDISFTIDNFSANYPSFGTLSNFSGNGVLRGDSLTVRSLSGLFSGNRVSADISVRKFITFIVSPPQTTPLSISFGINSESFLPEKLLGNKNSIKFLDDYLGQTILWMQMKGTARAYPNKTIENSINKMELNISSFSGILAESGSKISFNTRINRDLGTLDIINFAGNIASSDIRLSGRLVTDGNDNNNRLSGSLNISSNHLSINEISPTKKSDIKKLEQRTLKEENREPFDGDLGKKTERRKRSEDKKEGSATSSKNVAKQVSSNSTVANNTRASSTAMVNKNSIKPSGGGYTWSFDFPNIALNVNIKSLEYNGLNLNNLEGNINIKPSKVIELKNAHVESGNGVVLFNGTIDFDQTKSKNITLNSQISIKNLNLEDVGLKFNYGDSTNNLFIISEHFKGIINGNSNVLVKLNDQFEVLMPEMDATIDMSLSDGSIVNFSPMHSLSKYFRRNDLNNIRFSQLKNNMTINNGIITIPRMNIASTLGNFFLSGTQTFSGQMSYDVEVPWSVVSEVASSALFGGKPKPEVDEIIQTAIKRHYINLKIEGTIDNFKVKIGRADYKQTDRAKSDESKNSESSLSERELKREQRRKSN